MSAGRPTIADRKKLPWLAHHFYWELKSLLEPPSRIVVNRDTEKRLLLQVEDAAPLSPEALARLKEALDTQVQKGWLTEERIEERLLEMQGKI